MKHLIIALGAFSLLAGSAGPALASPCKDAKGKFVKCPAKPKVCRNAKGHFIKCRKRPFEPSGAQVETQRTRQLPACRTANIYAGERVPSAPNPLGLEGIGRSGAA